MPSLTSKQWDNRQIHVTADSLCFGMQGSEVSPNACFRALAFSPARTRTRAPSSFHREYQEQQMAFQTKTLGERDLYAFCNKARITESNIC
jgi:hypothetical protein